MMSVSTAASDRKMLRDEDLRADRQPGFTRIDVGASFMTAPQVRGDGSADCAIYWLER